MFRLYLDAGHGTLAAGIHDPGAVSATGLRECDVALAVVQKVKTILPKWIDCKLSRTHHNSLNGIDARVAEANDWPADLTLSLHCNSFTEPTANGSEILIYGTGGKAELYASEIINRYCAALGLYNRGIKVRTDLGILKKTNHPAVLLELAFLSNPRDELALKMRQEDMAIAIADAVIVCAKIAGKYGGEDNMKIETANVQVGADKTVPALLVDGVTYVPLRDIVDAIKPTVTWSSEHGAAVKL